MKEIDGQNDWAFDPDDTNIDIDLDDSEWVEEVKGLKTMSGTIGGWGLSIKGKVLYTDDQYTVVVLYYNYSEDNIKILNTKDFNNGIVRGIDIVYKDLPDEAKQEIVKEKI